MFSLAPLFVSRASPKPMRTPTYNLRSNSGTSNAILSALPGNCDSPARVCRLLSDLARCHMCSLGPLFISRASLNLRASGCPRISSTLACLRALSAAHALAIRRPHARYPLPTRLLSAPPVYPRHTRSIAIAYRLDGRRLCARYPPPVCSLPAARVLDPRPMHRLRAHYPPPTRSLSAAHALAIRCLRACYPPRPCPRYPFHIRSMAVARVLDGRRPCIRYPPPARWIPAPVHSSPAPRAQSLPPPSLPGPSILVPCTPDGRRPCARCLPLPCSIPAP
jgi:hypothetical protein